MKIELINDIDFMMSSKEKIIAKLGDIGIINKNDNSYLIKKGEYDIQTSLETLINLTKEHELTVEIKNGKIFID